MQYSLLLSQKSAQSKLPFDLWMFFSRFKNVFFPVFQLVSISPFPRGVNVFVCLHLCLLLHRLKRASLNLGKGLSSSVTFSFFLPTSATILDPGSRFFYTWVMLIYQPMFYTWGLYFKTFKGRFPSLPPNIRQKLKGLLLVETTVLKFFMEQICPWRHWNV